MTVADLTHKVAIEDNDGNKSVLVKPSVKYSKRACR